MKKSIIKAILSASLCLSATWACADNKGVNEILEITMHQSCTEGDALACFDLGKLYATGQANLQTMKQGKKGTEKWKVKPDNDKASTYLGEAMRLSRERCEKDQNANACEMFIEAFKLRTKGDCEAGNAATCFGYGGAVEEEKGFAAAKKYYEKSCQLGFKKACRIKKAGDAIKLAGQAQ